jgi:hypothetical protein
LSAANPHEAKLAIDKTEMEATREMIESDVAPNRMSQAVNRLLLQWDHLTTSSRTIEITSVKAKGIKFRPGKMWKKEVARYSNEHSCAV